VGGVLHRSASEVAADRVCPFPTPWRPIRHADPETLERKSGAVNGNPAGSLINTESRKEMVVDKTADLQRRTNETIEDVALAVAPASPYLDHPEETWPSRWNGKDLRPRITDVRASSGNCFNATSNETRTRSSSRSVTHASMSSSVSNRSGAALEENVAHPLTVRSVSFGNSSADAAGAVPRGPSLEYAGAPPLRCPTDAVVVNDVTGVLPGGRPVHACDRLEQLRFLDRPVQIEDLLDGCASNPVSSIDFNDEECDRGDVPRVGLRMSAPSGSLKASNVRLVVVGIGPLEPFGVIVVTTGDHRDEVEGPDQREMDRRAHRGAQSWLGSSPARSIASEW